MEINDVLSYIKKAVQISISKMVQYFQYVFFLDSLPLHGKWQNVT